MTRRARLAAAVLPLVGLGGLWGWSDYLSRQGVEWDVPIAGYDPRDVLRGHYVEFTYDWPGLGAAGGFVMGDHLCLVGSAPVIERTQRAEAAAELDDCANPVRATAGGVYGADSLRRGRLYLGQDRARLMDAQLRDTDQRGIVRVRVRGDGTMTPVDIRFRPLTAEERSEMADSGDGTGDGPAAIPDQ